MQQVRPELRSALGRFLHFLCVPCHYALCGTLSVSWYYAQCGAYVALCGDYVTHNTFGWVATFPAECGWLEPTRHISFAPIIRWSRSWESDSQSRNRNIANANFRAQLGLQELNTNFRFVWRVGKQTSKQAGRQASRQGSKQAWPRKRCCWSNTLRVGCLKGQQQLCVNAAPDC